jgi:hypothetical protein
VQKTVVVRGKPVPTTDDHEIIGNPASYEMSAYIPEDIAALQVVQGKTLSSMNDDEGTVDAEMTEVLRNILNIARMDQNVIAKVRQGLQQILLDVTEAVSQKRATEVGATTTSFPITGKSTNKKEVRKRTAGI